MSEREIEVHFFVCTNKRDLGKESCGVKGAVDFRQKLKDFCKKEYGNKIKITSSGCLGFCSKGIASVVYPHKKWYFNLQEVDLEEVKNQLECLLEK